MHYASELRNAEQPPQSRPMFRASACPAHGSGRLPMSLRVLPTQEPVELTTGRPSSANSGESPPREPLFRRPAPPPARSIHSGRPIPRGRMRLKARVPLHQRTRRRHLPCVIRINATWPPRQHMLAGPESNQQRTVSASRFCKRDPAFHRNQPAVHVVQKYFQFGPVFST